MAILDNPLLFVIMNHLRDKAIRSSGSEPTSTIEQLFADRAQQQGSSFATPPPGVSGFIPPSLPTQAPEVAQEAVLGPSPTIPSVASPPPFTPVPLGETATIGEDIDRAVTAEGAPPPGVSGGGGGGGVSSGPGIPKRRGPGTSGSGAF